MGGLIGTCLKCGSSYCGWALSGPEYQKCDRCGSELEIRRDDFVVQSASLPSGAAETRAVPHWERWKDMLRTDQLFYFSRN
jgi:hypothetical protein